MKTLVARLIRAYSDPHLLFGQLVLMTLCAFVVIAMVVYAAPVWSFYVVVGVMAALRVGNTL
jgi:hypothetical protein